mgnify:CR=1 FL=1
MWTEPAASTDWAQHDTAHITLTLYDFGPSMMLVMGPRGHQLIMCCFGWGHSCLASPGLGLEALVSFSSCQHATVLLHLAFVLSNPSMYDMHGWGWLAGWLVLLC